MSSKRGKQKETVEEDFEAFVRHQLSSISDDLKEMKGTQVKIQRDVESLQSQIKINESSISKLKESLDTKLEVLTGQLHESNTRIDQIQTDITKYAKEIDVTYERLLSLERHSMYLLTEWEGRTGKYLARGPYILTESQFIAIHAKEPTES